MLSKQVRERSSDQQVRLMVTLGDKGAQERLPGCCKVLCFDMGAEVFVIIELHVLFHMRHISLFLTSLKRQNRRRELGTAE